MAADKGKYPRKLFKHGLSVSKNRSINHYSNLKHISSMMKGIGEDAYVDIRENSCVGVFLKLADSEYVFTGRHVQYLLSQQLQIDKKYELWVVVGTRPIRFSLHEFAEITGLNCGLVDSTNVDQAAYEGLWVEMGLRVGESPTWSQLKKVLDTCRGWSFERRKMVGLLVVLYVGIYGCHPNSRIPSSSAKLVTDFEKFERHPWGRIAFKVLINSIKTASYENESYTIHGCVHALLIWAFEAVPLLAEVFGVRREGVNVPLLWWRPIKKQSLLIEQVVRHEKNTDDGKV